MASPPPPKTAFYCVSSSLYFLGAVGMINSLRLHGHDEPIYLLDLGLTPSQRELLAGEVTLVDPPSRTEPWLAKTIAPLRHPAETMVLIDVDMIVTRRLDEPIAAAEAGSVVAFKNDTDRWVPEWGEILDLEPRRLAPRPYLCSGFVALAGERGRELIELIDDRQRRVEFERTFFAPGDEESYPLRFLDQDILNAVLASRVPAEEVVALEHRLAPVPPFAGLRLLSEDRLDCRYEDGSSPLLVHQFLSPKPWEGPTYDGIYSRLLRRLLSGAEVAIRVPEGDLPLRLRRGPLAYAERRRIDLREQVRWRLGG